VRGKDTRKWGGQETAITQYSKGKRGQNLAGGRHCLGPSKLAFPARQRRNLREKEEVKAPLTANNCVLNPNGIINQQKRRRNGVRNRSIIQAPIPLRQQSASLSTNTPIIKKKILGRERRGGQVRDRGGDW